ncbi:hypothetical protein C1752_01871 [Acaryochloris thomasi RCC1774]|uniref:Nucleotidyltransferase family protein n=1 Tax=Acaryochloris thomasi RCC1774 TaxID=1764569 RepID=A0A2W1JK26_9CYAN|nr:nucleotidyltransferase family protein [Acaryochloris thomasi]PZD73770.1 hypothetical protein C1752_01871 [Acaryochloris thomasi RCC1774]
MVISANPIASTVTVISPEMQLVLYCARTQLNDAIVDQLQQLLQQPLDWASVIEAAFTHRVVPLLYQALNTHASALVPAEILEELQQEFQDNQLDNLALTQELVQLLKLLAEHQIPAISFKGPLLATTVYQNLALRTFSDLDILVHPQHFGEARDLLFAHGYRSGMQHVYLLNSPRHEGKLVRALGECPFQHPETLFCIDLHQRLVAGEFYHLSFTFDQIWYRLQTVSVLGAPIASLHPEDLLLYLCIHGAKDRWQRLSWVCDVAELVRLHDELNWADLVQKARWAGTEQMLLLGLVLARDLLAVELPDAIATLIKTDFRQQSLASQVRQQIIQGDDDADLTVNLWQRFIFGFQLLERFDDRSRCSLTFVKNLLRPTPDDREFYPLPTWLSFLYPVVRLARLLSQ